MSVFELLFWFLRLLAGVNSSQSEEEEEEKDRNKIHPQNPHRDVMVERTKDGLWVKKVIDDME